MKGKVVFLTLLFLVFILGSAFAANHFIRQGATGTGTCSDWTTANACPNLPASLIRGDTYYVATGTYNSHTFNDAESGSTLIIVRKASPSDHGTDTGWVASYGVGQAVFAAPFAFNSSYYTIDGQYRTDIRGGHGIQIDGQHYKQVTADVYIGVYGGTKAANLWKTTPFAYHYLKSGCDTATPGTCWAAGS